MDLYISEVKGGIIKGIKRDSVMNITKKEESAIRKLLNDNSIVIRPADKGSGIVVLDADEYNSQMDGNWKKCNI